MYRWGFRQVNRGIGPDDPIIFGNEYFQRDNAELMTKMRSTTAASTRKQEEDNLQKMLAQKRVLDSWEADRDQKRERMLFSTLMQQNMVQPNFGSLQQNSAPNFPPNQFLMQSLQQNLHLQQQQQQQGMFGSNGNPNMQLMNAFGSLPSSSGNGNSATMAGLKPFDVLAAQQQQQNQSSIGNPSNFNPLLNFQLPSSNNNLMMTSMNGMSNANMMNMSANSFSGSMNNFANNSMMGAAGVGGAGGGNQNPASTAEIVNAAINALKHAP